MAREWGRCVPRALARRLARRPRGAATPEPRATLPEMESGASLVSILSETRSLLMGRGSGGAQGADVGRESRAFIILTPALKLLFTVMVLSRGVSDLKFRAGLKLAFWRAASLVS